MSDVTVEKARALLDGATPGPWQVNGSHFYGPDPDRSLIGQMNGGGPFDANLALIAAAPDLARAYIAQAAEIGRLKAIIRVNGLRAGATHAEIDAVINGDTNVG